MEISAKAVDGFRFLPPGLAAWIRTYIPETEFRDPIPWAPMAEPLSRATVALITSAGISLRQDPPFDMKREKREPLWGDRSYRMIPRQTSAGDIEVNHLHINTAYILEDINVMLPLERMAEFEREGIIGRLAPTSYSFYGYQWKNSDFLNLAIDPMAQRMREEGVDAVLLTPA